MSEPINRDYDADEVINEFKQKFKWPKAGEVEAIVKPKNIPIKLLLSALITLVLGGIAYYIMIPAMNFKSEDMYVFLILIVCIFMASFSLLCKANKKIEYREYVKSKSKAPIIIVGVIIIVMLVGYLVSATIFRANSYSQLMKVDTCTSQQFSKDFSDIDYSEVPRIDELATQTLADNKLNELSKYVSQFVVADKTTQINYKEHPVRVAYLNYGGFFKWFNNTKNGLPAYMIIDMVTQEVRVVELDADKGIKYSPSEYFNEKLARHLRFQYPTFIMEESNFEIDDNQNPYWITPVLDKKIGLFGGKDVKGAIVTNAITGESQYYSIDKVKSDKSLSWIDVVYSSDLVLQQYNFYGKLSNGFWNSLIFQKDVKVTSSGNGYIALNDDVWAYTGVTSTGNDASNVGFILVNQRTKETRYYEIGGAMESGAMTSAQDAVQNYGYTASFPILLDIENQPTYFLSLKGDSNIVKMYAMISLKDRTVVGTGSSVSATLEAYSKALEDKGVISDANEVMKNANLSNADKQDADKNTESSSTDASKTPSSSSDSNDKATKTVTGEITAIKALDVDGNTYYYFTVDKKNFKIKAIQCDNVFVAKGDKVTVTYTDSSDSYMDATSVK